MSSDHLSEAVESLSKAVLSANPGDLSSVAVLIGALEQLAAASADDAAGATHQAGEAMVRLANKLLMDELKDPDGAVAAMAQSVELLQSAAESGKPPQLTDFPELLQLRPAAPAALKFGNVPHPAADQDVLSEFLAAQSTVLEHMEGAVLALEQGDQGEAFANLRRTLHTLKGESGFLGLTAVERVCHFSESLLEDKSVPFDAEKFLAIKDWLATSFATLSQDGVLDQDPERALADLGLLSDPPARPPAALPASTTAGAASLARRAPEQPSQQPAPQAAAPRPAVPPRPSPAGSSKDKPHVQLVLEPTPITGDTSLMLDFVSESKEHLEAANTQLLDLESDPTNEEALNAVFRAFHTIKGIAGFLELVNISLLAHDAENLLDMIRKGTLNLTAGLMDVIFDALDMMNNMIGMVKTALEADGMLGVDERLPAMLETIRKAGQGEFVERAAPAAADAPIGDLLVQSGDITEEDLNEVITQRDSGAGGGKLGELLIQSKKVSPKAVAGALRRQNAPTDAPKVGVELKETIRVDYERLEKMVDTIGELVIAEAMINQDPHLVAVSSEALTKKLHNLKMVSRQLQEIGTAVRMVPIAGTFQKMARLVRDLSKKSGKAIRFHTVGDETELDRAFVDKIGDPLVHMIRNAVDHGIEPANVRQSRGKALEGAIELRAFHEGGNIHIELQDDGKGLDPDVILAKAIEKGLASEEDRERLSRDEIFNIIFAAGFSTAAQVTEVSGRGVGMDVVRRNIEGLRGQVYIKSTLGEGTTFRLTLPLTMALIDGMVVKVGQERFIFPVLSVVESLRPAPGMVQTVLGRGEMLSLRNRQIPMYRLDQLFGVHQAVQDIFQGLVVVVENQGRQVGIVVDELLGLQQTVIKSLGAGLGITEGLSGGAIMADGTVGLIVDIPGLIKVAKTEGTVARRAG
ncbi:MAG: Hpt domain-containing protein [Candidatus Lambdaproteobacteria bacterium]|nr:Hpt domain-containing protein [Candidatus Lambdaproteobacteria bacterium]